MIIERKGPTVTIQPVDGGWQVKRSDSSIMRMFHSEDKAIEVAQKQADAVIFLCDEQGFVVSRVE